MDNILKTALKTAMNIMYLDEILKVLKDIRFDDGSEPPQKISELLELTDYKDYESIRREIKSGQILIHIPNHKLYDFYDIVVPRNERNLNSLLLKIPWAVALVISIFGMINGNFWLLISIPTAIISTLASAILGGLIIFIPLFLGVIYSFASGHINLGLILTVIFITLFFSHYIRILRRDSMIKSAMAHEAIFCFLFYSFTISLTDTRTNKMIYAQNNK